MAGINQPFYGTWVADFILRQNAGNFILEKYLSDNTSSNLKVQWAMFPSLAPAQGDWLLEIWRQRRFLRMAVADIAPTASQLNRIGKMKLAGCLLCRKVREARGKSTDKIWRLKHTFTSLWQGRLWRDDNDSYGCPPFHLEAPVSQHACCTKAQKQAQVCHAWQRK